MIQLLVMALVAVVLAHDALPDVPMTPDAPAWVIVGVAIGLQALIALGAHCLIAWCGRRLDRTGRWRYVALADRALALSRVASVAAHAFAVLGLGWLDLVRSSLGGQWVLIDEAVALAPPVIVFMLGWASYYAIDRRLRDATLVRALDGEAPPRPAPTCLQYVMEQTRHHLLIVLVPVGLIAAWSESIDLFLSARVDHWPWLRTNAGSAMIAGLHLVGVLLVLALMPLALRWLWRTVPLGAGPLRDRLLSLCRRQGVRCRELLVWRTHSGMLNGAVIGVLPWLRYILLTDALLERLPESEVEAVMAHEVAHARRHHLPWLMVCLIATGGLAWSACWIVLRGVWAGGPDEGEAHTGLAALAALAGAVAAGWVIFGYISRRFEEQADAFAAQHLSGQTREAEGDPAVVIRPEAVAAMTGALGSVAALNHIPPEKFSFRHGSILSRQRRLMKLVGLPACGLPIDKRVRGLKIAAVVGIAAVAALAIWDPSLRLW